MHAFPLSQWLSGDWQDPPPPPGSGEGQRPIYRKKDYFRGPMGLFLGAAPRRGEGRRAQE